MEKLKQLYLSVLLIGTFLIFLPQLCSADMAAGFLMYNLPIFGLVAFMGIWIIEALTIKDRLEGTPQRALFAALVVNLVTTLLGALTLFVRKNFLPENILSYESFVLLVLFFLLSILIEALILRFYYRKEDWRKVTTTSFFMNLKSYLFLTVFLIGDLTTIGGAIISAIIIPYFFLNTFKLLSAGRETSGLKKRIAILLIIVLSVVLYGVIFVGVVKKMPDQSIRKKAKDARIIEAMSQIRTKAELIKIEEGNYTLLDCDYDSEMQTLCTDIDINSPGSFTSKNFHTSQTNYCVYVLLNQKYDGKDDYYCIDSTGVAGRTTSANLGITECAGNNYSCPSVR